MVPPVVVPTTMHAPDNEVDALRRENAVLRQALEARKIIELAKALLMVRDGLSEPAAHRFIQKSSMDARVPMVEIARGLIPAPPRPGRVTTARVRPTPFATAAPGPGAAWTPPRRLVGRASNGHAPATLT
jgi:hypothetical protein